MKGKTTLKSSRPVTLFVLFSKAIDIFAISLSLPSWPVTQRQIFKAKNMVYVTSVQIFLLIFLDTKACCLLL